MIKTGKYHKNWNISENMNGSNTDGYVHIDIYIFPFKVSQELQKMKSYGCARGTVEYGETVLRELVLRDYLKERLPGQHSKSQNALYIDLGSKYLDIFNDVSHVY